MAKTKKIKKISVKDQRRSFLDSSILAEKWGAKYKRG